MPYAETHQPLEDLEGLADLADLADLVDLEGLEDLKDQELLKDPLQQYLWQHQQEEMPMIGLWGTFPKYSMETERMPETSSTPYLDTSGQTLESRASIHPYAKYPSRSPSSKDPK
jgi:hypothetical protein